LIEFACLLFLSLRNVEEIQEQINAHNFMTSYF
jgi:hypothetical protein